MQYVSDEEQSEIISECLGGMMQRDCVHCPAHHSKPYGRCCFGHKHEWNDNTCDVCIHTHACASVTHGTTRPRTNSRIIYPNRRPANPPAATRVQVNRPPASNPIYDYGPQPGEPVLVQQPIHPEPLKLNPNDNLFERFLKVSLWGAGEGFLEMALNFFRKRRPE